MLRAGDLVVGEPVTIELPDGGKRYRTSVLYIDRRFVYLQPPEEQGERVEVEPGTEVRLIVSGFGAMFAHTATVHHLEEEARPPRLALVKGGPPERMESRSALRLATQLKTQVEVLAADGAVQVTKQGEIVDLSAGGGRIKMGEPIPNGTNLHIRFALPGTSEVIDTPARVARLFPQTRRDVAELGLQFLAADTSVGDTIVKWILDQQRRRAVR